MAGFRLQLAVVFNHRFWQEEQGNNEEHTCCNEDDARFRHRKSQRSGQDSLWVPNLFLCELLYLVAVFDLVDENLGRLEARNEMLIDNDGGVARNVARYFFLALLVDKATESANIDIMPARHRILYNGKKSFYGRRDISFVDAGFFRNLIYNVCFRHGAWVLLLVLGRAKLICAARIKNNIEKF